MKWAYRSIFRGCVLAGAELWHDSKWQSHSKALNETRILLFCQSCSMHREKQSSFMFCSRNNKPQIKKLHVTKMSVFLWRFKETQGFYISGNSPRWVSYFAESVFSSSGVFSVSMKREFNSDLNSSSLQKAPLCKSAESHFLLFEAV